MNARALFPALPTGRRYRLLRRPPESILPSSPRPMRRDCHGRLIAALLAMAGEDCEIAEGSLIPWVSATFIGARHGLALVFRGEDATIRAQALASALPEADFAIPGHLVADVAVDGIATMGEQEEEEARLALSILTIEAW